MSLAGTDLNLLNALKVLLEEANVTHAGARLNMSQPAMSGALARLRRQFSDELLVRKGRDYELTPRAFELLPDVQETVRLITDALAGCAGFDPSTTDRVYKITLSDYALSIVSRPLTTRVFAAAPGAGIEFLALTGEPLAPDRAIVEHDVLIGPLGHGFPGTGEVLFRDRMVCLVDRANPRLRHGTLTLDDLRELPHAVASFGRDILTPADRVMGELAVTPRAQVTVAGWLAVPAVVEGTDMVAVVPERLRDQFAGNPALAVVEPPFDRVNLIEGFWYQQAKASEPALGWLLSILREVAAELDV